MNPSRATAPASRTRRRSALAAFAVALLASAAVPGTKGPATERVSVSPAGADGTNHSRAPSISADGRFVAFDSSADNLVPGDTNASRDVFVRDRTKGTTVRVSVDGAGAQVGEGGSEPSISANGRYVAFVSAAVEIVPGKTSSRGDIIVRDVKKGTTTRVSVDSAGNEADGSSFSPCISADGRFVAFQSAATNLVAGDTNQVDDVFLHDLRTHTTVRVSVGTTGNETVGGGAYPAISSGGRYVAFNSSGGDLVAGDTNGQTDIFVRDLKKRTTTRVSTSSNGAEGDGQCYEPTISSNGRLVAFVSQSTNLVPVNVLSLAQVYLHDAKTGATTRISGFTNDVEGNGPGDVPCITPNGRYVAFISLADNLVPGDTNAKYDVYVHDVKRGTLVLASVDAQGVGADEYSDAPSISADGRFVAFSSASTNLVPGDTNNAEDVFVRALR